MILIKKFNRKAFPVDAVQVTAENMEEVAQWCKGEVMTEGKRKFIKVKVQHPLNPKQTEATVGSVVLSTNTGFKVYTQKAFERSFEEIQDAVTEWSFEKTESVKKSVSDNSSVSFRDTETGEYVGAEYALKNPETTVKETNVFNSDGDVIETTYEQKGEFLHRSSGTGRFVTAAEVEADPAGTVTEEA